MPHASLWILLALPVLVGVVHSSAEAAGAESEPSKTTLAPATHYVEPREQLIVEIYVQDVKQSTEFYERIGFKVIRRDHAFVELGWDTSRLYLEQIPGQPAPPQTVVANIRIMVPDVDRYWKACVALKLRVVKPIDDRYYGLRDFTVVSPDGVGLRFASRLTKR